MFEYDVSLEPLGVDAGENYYDSFAWKFYEFLVTSSVAAVLVTVVYFLNLYTKV